MQGEELGAGRSSWGEFAVNRASLKGTRHVQGAPPRASTVRAPSHTPAWRAGRLGADHSP